MFNPQRKSKVSDIMMQEKWYQMHLSKIRGITYSSSPQKQRQEQEALQQKYLKRLSNSKRQVQSRINSDIKKSNHKLFLKLLDTDTRKQQNPEIQYFKNRKKHFNSYFSTKKQKDRIRVENFTMVTRMMNSLSEVPTLTDCKQEFKKNKKLQRKCRKLPAIFQHESQFKKKFSKRYLLEQSQYKSRLSTSRFSQLRLKQSNLQQKQKQLLSHELMSKQYSNTNISNPEISKQEKDLLLTK